MRKKTAIRFIASLLVFVIAGLSTEAAKASASVPRVQIATGKNIVQVVQAGMFGQNAGYGMSLALMGAAKTMAQEQQEKEEVVVLPEGGEAMLDTGYDFTKEVPVTEKTVKASYFDDALFIGNSLIEGFAEYTNLPNATYYCQRGLTVSNIAKEKCVTIKGKNYTVYEGLKKKKFSKIYLMFGINELGWNYPEIFIDKYTTMIKKIHKLQPNATIYVQSILPVEGYISSKDKTFNNRRVRKFNKLLKKMCGDLQVYYLDVYGGLADEDKNLPQGSSYDGIHLKPKGCKSWLKYLKQHTVSAAKK